jgi:hypothetical protein
VAGLLKVQNDAHNEEQQDKRCRTIKQTAGTREPPGRKKQEQEAQNDATTTEGWGYVRYVLALLSNDLRGMLVFWKEV